MMKSVSEKGMVYGEILVNSLEDGSFSKECRTNHGFDFTGGLEQLHKYRFVTYMSSCGCYLLNRRVESKKGEYFG